LPTKRAAAHAFNGRLQAHVCIMWNGMVEFNVDKL